MSIDFDDTTWCGTHWLDQAKNMLIGDVTRSNCIDPSSQDMKDLLIEFVTQSMQQFQSNHNAIEGVKIDMLDIRKRKHELCFGLSKVNPKDYKVLEKQWNTSQNNLYELETPFALARAFQWMLYHSC